MKLNTHSHIELGNRKWIFYLKIAGLQWISWIRFRIIAVCRDTAVHSHGACQLRNAMWGVESVKNDDESGTQFFFVFLLDFGRRNYDRPIISQFLSFVGRNYFALEKNHFENSESRHSCKLCFSPLVQTLSLATRANSVSYRSCQRSYRLTF